MAVLQFMGTALFLGISLIGITQAAEGDIRLFGSDRRIEGKLQIEHNDIWRSVCLDDWTHEDASTACRQLGYSKGAMIFKEDSGEFGGSSNPALHQPECTSSNNRLMDCPSFKYEENLPCPSGDVIMSCYVDEFNGCYLDVPISFQPSQLLPAGSMYSIQSCLAFCRMIPTKPRFASLAGPRCYCEQNADNLQASTIISASACAEPCTADGLEACGMKTGSSGTTGNYAVWPVTVGASMGSLITAEGCLYSRDFPGPYQTSSDPSTDTYTVILPSTAYVSLTVKMLDISDGDWVRFRDTTSGSAMETVTLTESDLAILPVQTRVSTFSISFYIAEDSPNMENYGFIICYESLAAPPPDPTTRPPPEPTTKAPIPTPRPPTDPPTQPPVVPPTVIPSTAPPVVPTNPPVVITNMPTTPERVMTTDPPIATTMPMPSTTMEHQETDVCPAYQGDTVENRPGRGPNNRLLINTGNPFNCTGFITSVSFYSASNQMFVLSVWRPQHNTNGYKYMITGQVQIQGVAPGIASVPIPEEDWLSFMPGDVMGVRLQTSPLVFSDMAGLPGDPIPWMSWGLEDGSETGTVLDVRDTIRATGLNYSYSLFASIKAKDRCIVPIVEHARFTDAVTAYVYEREAYTLECRGGYISRGGSVYTCQSGGSFDRPLECEDDGVIFHLTFTDIIILSVVLVLLLLTVFIAVCALLCCTSRGGGAKADKAAVAAPADGFDAADAALDDGESGTDDNQFLISIHDEESEGIPNTDTDNPHVYDNRDPTAAAQEAAAVADADEDAATDAAVAAAAAEAAPETEGTAVMDNPVHNMTDDSSQ